MKLSTSEIPYRLQLTMLWILLGFSVLWRGGKSLDATWILVGMTAIIVCLSLLTARKRSISLWYWVLGVAYIAWTVRSYASSTTANYGLDEVFQAGALVLLSFWIARYIRVRENLSDERIETATLQRLQTVIAQLLLFAVLIGFVVYIFQPVNRFVGTFFDPRFHTDYWPNAWAQFFLLGWPFVFHWALYFYADWQKRASLRLRAFFRAILFGIPLACFFLSYSRGAAIAFVGQLILLLLLHWWSRRGRIPLGPLLAHIVSIAAVTVFVFWGTNATRQLSYPVESVVSKVTFTAAEGKVSVTERSSFWRQSLQLIPERPWFGWGPYSFRFIQTPLQTGVLATSDHPHNVFLKLALERGIPAAVLFFLMVIGTVAVVAYRIRRFAHDMSPASASALILAIVSLCGVLAHNLIDYNLQFTAISLPFWLLLGALAAYLPHRRQKTYQLPVETILVVLLLLAGLREGWYLVLSSKGRHAEAENRPVVALDWYQKASAQLYSRDMLLSVAGLELETDQPDAAADTVYDYINLNPHDGRAWLLLAKSCQRAGDYVCALDAYQEAYDINRYNTIEILRRYVDLLYTLGQTEEIDTRRTEFERLINDYGLAIQENAHYIALSDNVDELQLLLNRLAELYPEQEPAYILLGAKIERVKQQAEEDLTARPSGQLW